MVLQSVLLALPAGRERAVKVTCLAQGNQQLERSTSRWRLQAHGLIVVEQNLRVVVTYRVSESVMVWTRSNRTLLVLLSTGCPPRHKRVGAVVALCSSPLQSWPFVVVVVFSLTDWELQASKGSLGQRCLTDGGPGTFVSKCVLKPPKPQRTAKIISVTMPF